MLERAQAVGARPQERKEPSRRRGGRGLRVGRDETLEPAEHGEIRAGKARHSNRTGAAWRPEHERAWGEAFGVVAGAMLEGAEQAILEAAA